LKKLVKNIPDTGKTRVETRMISEKIAVFGGTGFVGSYILKELSNNSYRANLLVRKGSEDKTLKVNNLNVFYGNISDVDSIKETIKHCEIIIYAVGIIREYKKSGITFEKLHYEYFKNIVDISQRHKIKKIIYISANGVNNTGTGYQTSKYKAEQYLKENFTNWTIFRPSVVFGDPKGKMEFVTQLKEEIIDKLIPLPLFFRINPFKYNAFFKSNPVHVQDLAELVVKSIDSTNAKNQTYQVGGPILTSWSSMLKSIGHVVGKKKISLPVPISVVQLIATIIDKLNILPITAAQIKMLKENNICNSENIFHDFGIKPTGFNADSIKYLNT